MPVEFKKTEADLHSSYGSNIKRAVILTLFLFNLIALFSPTLEMSSREQELPRVIISAESIPLTRQAHRTPPPPKPTVPIPSDDESIPEDETIEETTLQYTTIFDLSDGVPSMMGLGVTPPKPIAWVFPEYPDEDRKKGVEGVVKLSIHVDKNGRVIEVVVLKNTTNSENCAAAAIEAAYASRFFPAKEGSEPVGFWISQPYRFDIKK